MVPRSVLLIVDDALIRWALEKELSPYGVEAHGVETGAAALERIHEIPYGMAFVDPQLPDADGLTLLEPIRERSPDAKIVVLGCDASPEVKQDAFTHGAWQFVDKPFNLRDVMGLVRSRFGAHTPKRKHERYLCRLPLRVSLPAAEAEATPVELDNLTCTTVDVGAGGMRLRTGYRLRVGQRLRARVLRPQDPCASYMRPQAEVVWLDPTESGFSGGLRWVSGPTPGQTS
jgi:DNA-binding response OmpR family regulator